MAAASERLDACDFESARALANESLALLDQPQAHELLGAIAYMEEEHALARREWELAFADYRAGALDRQAARVALALGSMFSSDLHQRAVGNGWIERARLQLTRTGPCVEWGYLELAVMACERTDIDDLLAAAERALALALEFGDADLEARALADGGLALVSQGRMRDGFARLDAALAVISTGEVRPAATGMCFCSMLTACDRSGDLRRAEEWTQLVEGQLAANGDRPRVLRTHCSMVYGSVLCATGHWSAAEQLMNVALGPAEHPAVAHRAQTTAHLAALRVDQGRVEEAADLLAEYEDRVTSCAPLARVHLARGEPDLAAAVLRRGLHELVGDALRASPLHATLVEVELVVAISMQLAAPQRRSLTLPPGPICRRARRRLSRRGRVSCSHSRTSLPRWMRSPGPRRTSPTPAGRCSSDSSRSRWPRCWPSLGTWPAPSSRGAPRWRASNASGPRRRATGPARCFVRSATPAGCDPSGPSTSTRADQTRAEVLELVCAGLTNAEIAERLYISPKTAEHHVGRMLTKLGVRSRAEAAALAVRLGAK